MLRGWRWWYLAVPPSHVPMEERGTAVGGPGQGGGQGAGQAPARLTFPGRWASGKRPFQEGGAAPWLLTPPPQEERALCSSQPAECCGELFTAKWAGMAFCGHSAQAAGSIGDRLGWAPTCPPGTQINKLGVGTELPEQGGCWGPHWGSQEATLDPRP